MRLVHLLTGAATFVAAAMATPASAVVILGSSTAAGNSIENIDVSSSQISADFNFGSYAPTTINFGVEDGDAATYNFDSVIEIFTGVSTPAKGVASFVLALTNGATFNLGTVTPAFSNATTTLNAAGDAFTVSFTPAENSGVLLGSIDDLIGDFGINRNGLTTGDDFGLTVTAAAPVPEMSTWLMMIAGFGVIGATLRRSRKTLGPALA